MVDWSIELNIIRSSLTGNREENDLLVSPLLRGIIIDGNSTRGEFLALLRPGNVPIAGISSVLGGIFVVSETHWKTTSLGKASPALRVVIMGNY